jgi:FAD/FMN-containing dehydrogenase
LRKQKIAAKLKEAASSAKQDGTVKRQAALVKSIDNITTALSKVGWSDALGAKLQADEAALAALRAERARETKLEGVAIPVPHPALVVEAFRDLLAMLSVDPVRGREFLARHLGTINMRPLPEGSGARYEGVRALNLSFLLGSTSEEAEVSGCAGLI